MIPRILEILETKEHLMLEVESLHTHIAGKLTIATIPTLLHKLLPKVISQFKVDYPNVDIEVIESDRENIIKMLRNNKIDLGLIGKKESDKTISLIHEYPLNLSTNFKLIVPAKSKLTFKDNVNLEDIKDYPFILYDRSLNHHHLKKFEEKNGQLKFEFRKHNPIVV